MLAVRVIHQLKAHIVNLIHHTDHLNQRSGISGGSKVRNGEYRAADVQDPAQNVPYPAEPPEMNTQTKEKLLKFLNTGIVFSIIRYKRVMWVSGRNIPGKSERARAMLLMTPMIYIERVSGSKKDCAP